MTTPVSNSSTSPPNNRTVLPETGGVVIVIPALDEEAAIGGVLRSLPRERVRGVIVADNGSRDRTAERARAEGALVVAEPRRGYGRACLAALRACRALVPPPAIVVFIDADGSDDPSDLAALLAPIEAGALDLVIGSRTRGEHEPGSLSAPQRIGNGIATVWIRLLTGVRYTDLGPFRAIRWTALEALGMEDPDYGWTIEMQLKAALAGCRSAEVPVRYRRRRAGKSKVSGSIRGVVGASIKILSCLIRHTLRRAR